MATSLVAESLFSLAVNVTSEQDVESVLKSIVEGLASQPGVALARIWLLPSVDLPSVHRGVSDFPDCLCLVASAGTPINSPGEDWCSLQGHFARVRFNVGKVGQVAASRRPILVEDVAVQNDWIVRPEWAKREEIRSFAGHPLIFRDQLLGVLALFSRQHLGPREFTWLGLFANQAAVAIANACAEKALRASEHNLAAIINTIPTTAWTTRADGYCDFLNQRWLDYTGMNPEQAQGWGWAEAIHRDDREQLVRDWQSSLTSGIPIDTEARIRRFDSSYRWFLIRANPLRDQSGSILKWYATGTEIEDRKRWEQILRARELSWKQIVDNIPGLVATTGAMGEVEFLNRQTLEYFGRTNQELKDWALIGAVHPDDLPGVIEARKKSIEMGQTYEVEHRCRRADGVYRWFQVRGLPVRDAENKVTAWYLLLTDIDDRKKAEEALQSSERNLSLTINAIPTFIGVLRTDGSLLYVNQTALDYTGVTLEDMQEGDYRFRFFHPDDLERLREERREALTRAVPFENEQRLLGKDGKYRWFLIRYNPLLNEQGRIDRWYAAAFDIEDRKRAEEDLRASELDARLSLDNMPSFLVRLSPAGTVEFVNQPFLQYFGKTLEEINQWSTNDMIDPDLRAHVIEVFGNSLLTGEPFDMEYRLRRFDGVYRWFQTRANPVRSVDGRILHWNAVATDTDDRRKAEEALQASERNLNQIINAIPTCVGVMHPDGTPLYGNQAVTDYTGLTMEDMLKENFRTRLFHPEDMERSREMRRLAFSRPVPFENEQRALGKDGKYHWFLFRYKPLLDETGKIDRWYMAAFDIEDRKKAEEALKSSERNLSLTINTLPTLAWSTSPDGSVDFLNQRWLDYTGLSPEQAMGWGWTVAIHPDDLKQLAEYWQSLMATGGPGEAVARFRRFDGEYRWFLFRANAMRDESGAIVRWYGTNTDIDDRKRAEAQVEQAYLRLAEAQRVSKTGSFITDLVADEHNWSEETFRIFDFDPVTKVTQQRIRSVIHPEDLPSFEAVIARAMTDMDVNFVFRIVGSRGTVKHLRGMARIIEQVTGRPLFIGALQDVTESKIAEEALNKARSELAHVTRVTTLNALTASIAHEVNQPLSGIVSNASASLRFLAGDSPNLEEAREAVRDIVRDGKRAGEIITRIRGLTKRNAAPPEKLDLNETISEVLALIGDEAKRNSVIVRTQFADALSPIEGDRVQLQQVVLNLVMNAIEAMSSVSERPRDLVITTRNTDADCVHATVEDSGIGIGSDITDKVFDSFYTTKPGGMGMGLSISRSILQSHGGRLWAVGKDGPGTIFHFTVPKFREEGVHARVTGS